MALIWNDLIYSTGVEEVDKQHKELFNRINELLQALKKGATQGEIGRILDFLGAYVKEHFEYEEKVMDEMKCPSATRNRQEHRQFIQEFTRIRKQFDEEGASLAVNLALSKKTVEWLNSHIKKVDSKLRDTVC